MLQPQKFFVGGVRICRHTCSPVSNNSDQVIAPGNMRARLSGFQSADPYVRLTVIVEI